MKYFIISIFLLGILALSCSGVEFANAPVNKELPETFIKRAIYPAGVAGYEFQDLVGNILLIKNIEDPVRIGIIRPNDYKNEIIPITDPNNYYKSRIQKGAEAQGSYLGFAANLKVDQLAELELIDIARASITFNVDSDFEQIIEKAATWIAQHPKDSSITKRLWIKSVILTRKIYNEFTNVGANASGQVGDVVGVSTGVYNKTEDAVKSVIIGFEAFDIDELVKHTIVGVPDTLNINVTKSINKILDYSIFTGQINGIIKEK